MVSYLQVKMTLDCHPFTTALSSHMKICSFKSNKERLSPSLILDFFSMTYSLRYRKPQGRKGLDLTPALYEPHEDAFDSHEAGSKKYRPRFYRANVFHSKSEVTLLLVVTVLALATRTWMLHGIDTSVSVYMSYVFGTIYHLLDTIKLTQIM
jgi:hypothetical protein